MNKNMTGDVLAEMTDAEFDSIIGAGNGVVTTISHECNMNSLGSFPVHLLRLMATADRRDGAARVLPCDSSDKSYERARGASFLTQRLKMQLQGDAAS